jgi:hypothetical protein
LNDELSCPTRSDTASLVSTVMFGPLASVSCGLSRQSRVRFASSVLPSHG